MTALSASSAGVKDMADGSLRITFEFEPCHAADAYALFGARGRIVAIAAFKDGSFLEQKTEVDDLRQKALESERMPLIHKDKPVTTPKIGDACRLAVQWCREPVFWEWIEEAWPGRICRNTDEAKIVICQVCDVASRRDLDAHPLTLHFWRKYFQKPFRDYMAEHGFLPTK